MSREAEPMHLDHSPPGRNWSNSDALAAQTRVPISKTKTDIEELLTKHGAAGFVYVTEGDRAMVAFNMSGRRIQLMLVMPSIDDFARTPRNARRTAAGPAVGLGADLPSTLAGVAPDNPGQVGGGGSPASPRWRASSWRTSCCPTAARWGNG